MSLSDGAAAETAPVPAVADPGSAGAASALANSLTTIGYAMFALLQPAPLDQIPPMSAIIAQVGAAPEMPAPSIDVPPAPSAAAVVAEIGEELDATPAAPVAPVAAAPSAPAPAAQPPTPSTTPTSEPPVYTHKTTMAMLNEISFLDE